MPEAVKDRPSKVVPKDLPLPTYDYQKPVSGSFTVKHDSNRERDRSSDASKAPLASIQNLKLVF
ncbi:hypothetical protein OKC48_20570 [Methylorubrum extorquens]|uniref:hypothetical protein n=1 Tax=Methylorubrum extorquens TaxID=408 RepID=UPI0022379E43|nr:hypothetical protein [Methylorubrum extorquens]UYW25642.1 hypothetical protein OKC48_20570 [Methylorubrum extorquens]